ncbi:MAG: caspase family protein, partial [Nitrospira sp.]
EVHLGILQSGEIKRTSITQRVTASQEALQGELTLNLRTTSPVTSVPPPKVFRFGVKPTGINPALVPNVDNLPNSLGAFHQPKAIIISIGIGTFRDEQVAAVKYARHDAEVMSEYLRIIGGVPGQRIRILLDRQALKRDLEDTFEQWLRKRADRETVVYIFFAGRALVDGGTGAISLVPYDGTLSEAKQQLYPLARLQEALYRLPIRRAILMFDVSMDPSPGAGLADIPSPAWESPVSGARKDVEMWMVGNRSLQEADPYDEGKHGLFTYHLLRGLQGMADVDRDGTVIAGELCTYARGQAALVAREQFGNKQDALCLPATGRGGMVRIHPMARGHNPKPDPIQKPPHLPADSSVAGPKPMQIGP